MCAYYKVVRHAIVRYPSDIIIKGYIHSKLTLELNTFHLPESGNTNSTKTNDEAQQDRSQHDVDYTP